MNIESYFDQVWETSEGFKANCPACGDHEKKFSWNTEKQVGCCFHSSCRYFYQRGGVTLRRLMAWFGKSGMERIVPEIIEKAPEADVSLPKEFRLIDELESKDRGNIYAYLESRHLPRRIVDKAKIGYCPDGKFWGYIILPVFDEEGNVVYWQGRRFKNREPKFWNPKSSKKSEMLYCISRSRRPKILVLVESVINTLTLESLESGKTMIVGILGKSLSEEQRDQILAYEKWIASIVIALDGDARRDAVSIAEKFLGILPVVKIANVPNGEDINSLGREKAWHLIHGAEIFNPKKRIEFMTREV
jgi:DNA primase